MIQNDNEYYQPRTESGYERVYQRVMGNCPPRIHDVPRRITRLNAGEMFFQVMFVLAAATRYTTGRTDAADETAGFCRSSVKPAPSS